MKKRNKFLALLLAFVTIASLGACDKDNGKDTGNSSIESSSTTPSSSSSVEETENIEISISETQLTLVEDETKVLSAMSNVNKPVTWTSDNEAVATVSVVGKVIAKTAGTATITAQVGKTTVTCTVTVVAAEKIVDYIDVESTAYLSLHDENAPQILPRYVAVNEGGEKVDGTKQFTFTSLNTDVVTVDETGVLTSVGLGKADIEVRCGDLVTYVIADVYTDVISTTEEWFMMLADQKEARDVFARYYLACDLDFTGVEYNIAPYAGMDSGFCGELNGGYHTLSNVTVTGACNQSLLGGGTCVDVYDIAFTNVTYTSNNASGLFSSLLQHVNLRPNWSVQGSDLVIDNKIVEDASVLRVSETSTLVLFPSKVNNVILDAEFIGHGNVGFAKYFYGGVVSNVYINMRRGDDQAFNETDYMFAQTLYIWWGAKAASNIVVLIEAGVLNEEMARKESSEALPLSNVSYTLNGLEANYKAHQMFDKAVWVIPPMGLPTFAKKQ